MSDTPTTEMSIGELGHRPRLPVEVNLSGMTVGGLRIDGDRWVRGAVVAASEHGTYVTVKLDTPIGADAERHGLFHRSSSQEIVSIDNPAKVRADRPTNSETSHVSAEVAALAKAGKKLQAIKSYRAATGATLAEASAVIDKLS